MNQIPSETLIKIQGLLPLLENEEYYVKTSDFKEVFTAIADVIKTIRLENQSTSDDSVSKIQDILDQFTSKHSELKSDVDSKANDLLNIKTEFNEALTILRQELDTYKTSITNGKDGEDGKDADIDEVISKVMTLIKIPDPIVLDNGDAIVAKINDLPTDDPDCQIDWIHIKNVPDFKKAQYNPVAASRFLSQLVDVDLTTASKNAQGQYIIGSGTGGATLKTNGTTNGSQSILNLKNGTNVTITDDGVGGITINSASGSAPSIGGTITGGTKGSVLFVNPAGKIAQDNPNFYVNDSGAPGGANTNIAVSINTMGDFSGDNALNIYGQMTAFLFNSQITNTITGYSTDGAIPGLLVSSLRGNLATGSPLQAGDTVGGITYQITGGTTGALNFTTGAGIYGFASGSTTTDLGGTLGFFTKADGGALAQTMTLNSTGLSLGTIVPTNSITLGSTSTGMAFYNTSDQVTNYEKVTETWNSNVFQIGAFINGTGTTRSIRIGNSTNVGATVVTRYLSINVATSGGAFFDFIGANTGVQMSNINLANVTFASSTSAIQNGATIAPTVSQSSTASFRGLWITPFMNTVGSGFQYLIDAGTNSAANGGGTHTSKFTVDTTGAVVGFTFNAVPLTAVGSSTSFLNASGTYTTPVGTTSIGMAVGSGTAGSVLFIDGSGNLGQNNANFFWDNTNNRLGLLTSAPTDTFTLGTGSTQTFYSTADQITNYERIRFQYQGASNIFSIGSYGGGTGTVRSLTIGVANANGTSTLAGGSRQIIINQNSTGNIGIFDFTSAATGNGSFMSFETTFTGTTVQNAMSLQPTITQTSGGGYRMLFISPFENTTGSGTRYLIDAGTNSAANGGGTHTSLFNVTSGGNAFISQRLGIGSSTTTPTAFLMIGGTFSTSLQYGTLGFGIQVGASTYTSTFATSTVTLTGVNTFGIPTLAASNATTLTSAATVYIDGAPAAGTNVTIGSGYALYVNTGISAFNGGLNTGTGFSSNFYAIGSNGSANGITSTQLLFGGASTIALRSYHGGTGSTVVTANSSYANTIIAASPVTTSAGAGVHALLANMVVRELGTVTASVGTVTNTASLYIAGASSATVSGANYALWVNAGTSLFGGDVKLGTVGNGIYVKEGTNATMGVATLVGGTVTVSTTKVTTSSRIFLSVESLGTVTAPVAVAVTARTGGTSFVITSANVVDTSVVSWVIIEPS